MQCSALRHHHTCISAGFRPRSRLHVDRRIDFSAICFGTLLHIGIAKIHI
jgi:hypothetical protein